MENVKLTPGTSYMVRRNTETDEWFRVPCRGYFFDAESSDRQPVTLFVHRYQGEWQADCPISGARVTKCRRTREEAVSDALELVSLFTRSRYDEAVIKERKRQGVR